MAVVAVVKRSSNAGLGGVDSGVRSRRICSAAGSPAVVNVWYDFLSGGSSMAGARAMVSSLLMLLTWGASSSFSDTMRECRADRYNAKMSRWMRRTASWRRWRCATGRIVAYGNQQRGGCLRGKRDPEVGAPGQDHSSGLDRCAHARAGVGERSCTRSSGRDVSGVKSIAALLQEIEGGRSRPALAVGLLGQGGTMQSTRIIATSRSRDLAFESRRSIARPPRSTVNFTVERDQLMRGRRRHALTIAYLADESAY